jgi:addiction module RelB/DinJ family antitoxin
MQSFLKEIREMSTVNYTIRLDEADKRAAEQVFNQLGLTLASGLNVYLKMVARQKRIPFELALNDQNGTPIVTPNTTPNTTPIATPVSAISRPNAKIAKERSIMAIKGVLAGYEIDLDKEREERIMSI